MPNLQGRVQIGKLDEGSSRGVSPTLLAQHPCPSVETKHSEQALVWIALNVVTWMVTLQEKQ